MDHPPLPEDIAGDPLLQPLNMVAMAGTDELLPQFRIRHDVYAAIACYWHVADGVMLRIHVGHLIYAVNSGADRDGLVLDHPPLPEDIAGDPLLQPLKLVAMAGTDELLPRNGERGFPHSGVWLERNRRFTRDVVQLLGEGRHGKASAIATRYGSRESN